MTDARPRPITVADVAKAARVSKATAARVLGGYGVASERAQEHVLAAAQALDYRPNELARSMTTGRSGIIGVVVGDIENPFFSLAVRGISDTARAAGFHVILANSGEAIAAEKAAVRMLVGRRVDGLIVTPADARDTGHLREVAASGRPLALLDRPLPDLEVDAVTSDDRAAAAGATRLLAEAGHRRIAYVTAAGKYGDVYSGPGEISTASVGERIEGFLSVCREVGIEAPERLVALGAAGAEAAGRLAHDLLGRPAGRRPTGVIASDSLIGLEVFRAIQALGLAAPGDVSLVTFHDADWTGVTTPPVTAIDQPVYALGAGAADLLLSRLRGEAGPARRLVLPTRLIRRGSVATPAAGDR